MTQIRTPIDAICRSLLQKAVRRADVQVTVSAAIRLIDHNETLWLRNRLGVISFEECWQTAENINFNSDAENLISQYVALAKSSKNKDAAGLGSLAYELSIGNSSVLISNDSNNRHLKIICEAIKRPNDFWSWIKSIELNERQTKIVMHAESGFRLAGWPWDKAFAISTAYLSATSIIPPQKTVLAERDNDFPYWIAIDKHTPEGKRALNRCEDKLKIDKDILGWIQFYLESAKCYALEDSYWWTREQSWRLAKYGLNITKAELIWNEASTYLKELLTTQQDNLINRLKTSELRYNTTINKQEKLI
ncbi:MAG: hypothetical protein KKC24_05790 [Gammaproteobacteria bacterium]|nr:hypothetical protein [Gammaproteobacteria bacterium]MBU0818345.1 hypothetical protein [Gammaproteobacteria bacterium]MBU0843786.1 hypothetical protein [Gammaproteobacteria bacterium]MBU1840681.1 hypothetical protein [Gammaproteobacteria bacterium]